jgi:hypothetical protein
VDADRIFLRINSVFCFLLGLSLLSRAVGIYRSLSGPTAEFKDIDTYLDLLLRYFAQQSFHFAVFATYIPSIIFLSLIICFSLFLHERNRWLAIFAFLSGGSVGVLWLYRQLTGKVLHTTSARFHSSTSTTIHRELFAQFENLYYYDSMWYLILTHASLVAYLLFGLLFLMGKGLEFFVGSLFIASSILLIIAQYFVPSSHTIEAVGVFIVPALAFLFSSLILWRNKPSVGTAVEPIITSHAIVD